MSQTKPPRESKKVYDVVVVGGGAAGLSGALALGRSRRSVLVLDGGDPRNASAGHVHNYLGREGTPPLELLAIAREEVAQYGVQVEVARVTAVCRWSRADAGFVVTVDDGSEVMARRLLVASGMSDVLPDLPGLTARWGRDVLHCPYCHGWEVRDRTIAVLATNCMGTHQALLFSQLSDRVTLVVTQGSPPPSEADREALAARGVRVVSDQPTRLVVDDDKLNGLQLASGDVLECEAVVVSPTFHARADFLATLGIKAENFEVNGEVLGTTIPAEPTGATSVPGVWVAGNLSDPMAQVISSAAAGLRAGALINADLVEEDTRRLQAPPNSVSR